MAWNDRIRQAAYSSPNGTRVVFGGYENVKETVEKKTTAFEFPDAPGTYVQDLGHSGRRYPFLVYFWGENYDLESNVFMGALLETGVGKLEHPIYGTKNVVPFGAITRRDDLKTAANQSVFEVVFWETTGVIYPTSQTDPASAVLLAVAAYNEAAAAEFEEVTSLSSAVEQATVKGSYQALLDSASSGLREIADTQEDVSAQFNAIVDSIDLGLDILVGQPLTLAFQTAIMIQAPARALTSITARLDAYANLASSIISGPPATQGNDSRNSNDFHVKNLYASTYATGSVVSTVNNQFATKSDAIAAAEVLLTQLSAIVDWRDLNFESLGEIDTGAGYQKLQESVALAAGFLVEISFTLKQERRIVLDRNRTIIDLVSEVYGSIDDQLDFFINSNDLSGSEILELPKGREIVYYA